MTVEFIQLLLLIIIANGSPVLIRIFLGDNLNLPVDFGAKLSDDNPVLGSSKTWRGIIAALFMTAVTASLMNFCFVTGLLIGCYAVVGDLLSSFIKRRLALLPSSKAPLLDQVPESFLPAFMMMHTFNLEALEVLLLVAFFVVIDLVITHLLYYWRVLKRSH